MRRFIALAGILWASNVFGQPSDSPAARVIWVTIDTLRADHLGYMGYTRDTSPFLDLLASDSINFKRALAPSNVTRWSVSSFFTGKYSRDLVDREPPLHLPAAEKTIAELFQEAGFATAAWTANAQIPDGLGYEQGFDEYRVVLPRSAPHATIEELIRTVSATYEATDGPEFLYFQTMDVHAPWRPPIPYDRMYTAYYDRGVVNEGSPRDFYGRHVLSTHPYFSQVHDMQPEDTEFVVGQYDGLIRYTDDYLPQLLESVNYDPGADVLIVTSDHGEAFFEHGFLEHGRHLFPEEIHVPLLIRVPGIPPAARDEPVSLMDLVPTLAELFDLELPPDLVGQSLVPEFAAPRQSPRYIVSEHSHRATPAAVLVGDGYWYRLNGQAHLRYPWRAWPYIEELYDYRSDPGCRTDLLPDRRNIADEMHARLVEQNPKFAPYTTALIRRPIAPLALGPNLLEEGAEWIADASNVRQEQDGRFQLRQPAALFSVEARVGEPGHAYMIEVEYRLHAGALRLKLQNTLDRIFDRLYSENAIVDPDIAWDYPLRKPSPEWKKVKAVVYPRSRTMYFIAAFEKPGLADIRRLSLRRLKVPEPAGVPPVPELPPENRRSAPAGLTPELRNRLQSLGYM